MKDIANTADKKIRLQQTLIGGSFTALWVTAMAMTSTLLATCIDVVMLPSGEGQGLYRQAREREVRTLKLKPNMLIFAAHNLPLKSD